MCMSIFTLAFNNDMLGHEGMGNCTVGLTCRVSGHSRLATADG